MYRKGENLLRTNRRLLTVYMVLMAVTGIAILHDYLPHPCLIFFAATSARRYVGPCAIEKIEVKTSVTDPLCCKENVLWAEGT